MASAQSGPANDHRCGSPRGPRPPRPLRRRPPCRASAGAELPRDDVDLAGYGAWLAGFIDAVGITEPVFLVGHSFGGAVSIQFAHDHQERVRTLVRVSSVGGSAWSKPGRLAS